jgi:hypothetical protein
MTRLLRSRTDSEERRLWERRIAAAAVVALGAVVVLATAITRYVPLDTLPLRCCAPLRHHYLP